MIVTLYRRPECHLCDEAREAIAGLATELGGIELREIDIESDEELFAAYLERIPVIEVEGEIVGELDMDPHELHLALAALHTVGQ